MTDRAIADTATLSGWRKSSYSGNEAGSCLEVVDDRTGVAVRDSKVVDGPAVVFSVVGWTSFIAALKD
ncbi:DUF397 domain-containing protein [Streptomyces griseoloalbus]|uniref:DUF397 domain-containing protein n=1 Tax=Streptomyces griseoloalbus TaxID=67303 RepID=A0A7W8F6Z1_9ACTN|nr:DUF397 domain-containing protein [Streptomyces albaduncus]MBB5123515.1 hypothetical protein [Streptomyces albaduncus]GGV56517.1 hypothetical protein GCM10010294_02300 [Streptomyces griseoloalbus]GGW80592.1 hypothetical protein GCM10010340_68470 [Streptomyces albaduncus]